MNIKTAFLYGDVEKTIYMIQFMRFEVKGKKSKVYKFMKALYDLK